MRPGGRKRTERRKEKGIRIFLLVLQNHPQPSEMLLKQIDFYKLPCLEEKTRMSDGLVLTFENRPLV